MKLRFLLLLALFTGVAATAPAQADKFVKFPGGPKINFTVPMGYSFDARNNTDGSVGIKMENPVWNIGIVVIIANVNEPGVTTRAWQENKLIEHIAQHMSRARESDYRFQALTPVKGTGLFCVFSSLGANDPAPPTDGYTHATGGIKAWPGVVVLFHIFSNGATSAEYREALDLFSWSFTD